MIKNDASYHSRLNYKYDILTRLRRRAPPVAHARVSYQTACTTSGSRSSFPSDSVHHRRFTLEFLIRRRAPPVAHARVCHQAAYTTGDSHLNLPLDGAYHQKCSLATRENCHIVENLNNSE